MTGSWATGGRSSSDTRAAERWRLGDGPKPARVPRQRRPVIHQRAGISASPEPDRASS